MIDERAKRVIGQILTAFETGSPIGGYGTISVLPDGAGLTGGRHQATDGAGNLDLIVLQYITVGGKFASEFEGYIPMLKANESRQWNPKALPQVALDFINLWKKAAAEDPLFCEVQDDVFDAAYWAPCAKMCESMKLTMPLSWAAIYDTCIQSGPSGVAGIRYEFPELPPARGGNEALFTYAYLRTREHWLATFESSLKDVSKRPAHTEIVRKTVYRPKALLALADQRRWALNAPFALMLPKKTVTIPG